MPEISRVEWPRFKAWWPCIGKAIVHLQTVEPRVVWLSDGSFRLDQWHEETPKLTQYMIRFMLRHRISRMTADGHEVEAAGHRPVS